MQLCDYWKSIKTFLKTKNKKSRGWCKKDKKIDWNMSFNKRFYILQNQIQVFKKKKVAQLVEPSKFGNIFLWSNFLKEGCILIHQISLMKNIQWKCLSCHIKDWNKTTNGFCCSKLQFWCACISHGCNLFWNIVLRKYK